MEDDRDTTQFPDLPPAVAIGFTLATVVGSLYLLSAAYHAWEGGSPAQRGDPNRIALCELARPSGS